MTEAKGMLTKSALAERVEQGAIETVIVAFTDHYGRLMGKRFDARFFLAEVVEHGAHACDYLLTVDMEMNPVPGYRFANWERGYGDFHLVPDPSTLRLASWLDRSAMIQCDLHDVKTGELVSVAPRTILHRQLERAKASKLAPKASSELE